MKPEQKENFRVMEVPSNGSGVIFLFAGFGVRIWHYGIFYRLLAKQGFTVYVYDYPNKTTTEANLNIWKKNFENIIQDAKEKIVLQKAKGAKTFGAYGISMGSLFANMLARESKDVTHIILNMTYGDVATHVWYSPIIRKARKNLLKQNIDINTLRKSVAHIDPITNAAKLKGKKIVLYLSRRDRILVYKESHKTKLAFEKAELNFEYIENKYLGHFLGGTKNLFYINKITQFFRSQ